jgi:hypothetical protein
LQQRTMTLVAQSYQQLLQKAQPTTGRKRKRPDQDLSVEMVATISNLAVALSVRSPDGDSPPVFDSKWLAGTKRLTHATLNMALFDGSWENVSAAICAFVNVWSSPSRKHQSPRIRERLAVFGVNLLLVVHDRCQRERNPDVRAELLSTLSQLLWVCTNDACLRSMAQTPSTAALVLEAVNVLSVSSMLLESDTHQGILESLAGSFHRLLSSDAWPVRHFAMTSLVHFASTIPAIHKTLLPLCVPPPMQKLLQCRLQGTVMFGENPSTPQWRLELRQCDALAYLVPTFTSKATFPRSTSLTISIGSYMMTMPTQEGRRAIVIFPPGDESLEDINFMLAMDENDNDANHLVRTVARVCTDSGGQCKLVLQA